MDIEFEHGSLVFAYTMYLIATLSPGPANLAIAGTSMRFGRTAGLSIALGVILGSLTWGVLAAIGLSAFLLSYGWLMNLLRVVGGLYLLWLAYKALKSASSNNGLAIEKAQKHPNYKSYFLKGLAIHLTNPKSIFAWLAIIAVGVGEAGTTLTSFIVVVGCWLMGICIFSGLALLFSTESMARTYLSFRRWIDGLTGLVFGFAGLSLMLSAFERN
ncbi:MAG: LysE family translocator [Alphaproteobacteria bacterium]